MGRGARRAPIFKSNRDRVLFLKALGRAVDRHGIEIHSYSLMPNHYHLFARSLLGNVSRFMQYLISTYTLCINARYKWDGPIFRGRFTSQIVGTVKYQKTLLAYIHLNPIEANLVNDLTDQAWTSHRAYLGLEKPPEWLETGYMLRIFSGRSNLAKHVNDVRAKNFKLPSGIEVDDGFFLDKTKKASKSPKKPDELPLPVFKLPPERENRFRKPNDVIKDVCELTGKASEELLIAARGRGANPARRFAVWALRRSTTCTAREIAEILQMSTSQVEQLLNRSKHGPAGTELTIWMDWWLSEICKV